MTHAQGALPPLIAHRGNAAEYPENTLEALTSAVELGVRHVEFDVQLTADHVPVVCHDADLQRMAGRPDCVHDLAWPELALIPAGEAPRLGPQFPAVRIPSLARVIDALATWSGVTAFVEVKRASLRRFGAEAVLERVAADVAPLRDRCVLISFDLSGVARLRAMTGARIGWVIERFDAETERLARELAPDYLFGDVERVPAGAVELWRGAWQWALYEVRDLPTARRCARLGAGFVETMAVRALTEAYARASAT